MKIFGSMPVKNEWAWKIRDASYNGTQSRSDIETRLKLASSAKANTHISFEIRDYADKKSSLGNLDWWKHREGKIDKTSEGVILYNRILDVFTSAARSGSELCMEGISIILNKDPGSPVTSLTSVMHTDRFCGPQEAGICSIMEKGFDTHGGTLLLPDDNMVELSSRHGEITMHKLTEFIGDQAILATESNDLYFFNGMDDKFGITDQANGIPHISGDTAGNSARLVLMIRNKPARFHFLCG